VTVPADPAGDSITSPPAHASIDVQSALASTGVQTQLQLILAGLLLVTGGLIVLASTRRRNARVDRVDPERGINE
jgi:LPXTG-motif cell wall-anchored protein